jgi:hypothetical protein
MASRPPPGTVRRRIHFYRARVPGEKPGVWAPFDERPALRHVQGLRDAEVRYQEPGEAKDLYCWVDALKPRARIRLATIRHDDLPRVERRGQLSDLQIPADAGLAELTHMIFFADGVVGAEFNFHGPRATRLGHYLSAKTPPESSGLQLFHILRGNTEELLNRLQQITALRIKIHASALELVKQADRNLWESLDAARRASHAERIELVLQPERRSGAALLTRLRNTIRKLAQNPALPESITALEVHGRETPDGPVKELNILNALIVEERTVVTMGGRSRAVQSESAFEAIEAAYENQQRYIESGTWMELE